MYSSCIYCSASLGKNEAIESFPVGRRLAFDPSSGRLWVVCRTCARWNLTPLEERWEAIEDCERRYRATQLRASTDNIGLAKLPEGVDLIRIGRALRPELALWRYSKELIRRRQIARLSQAMIWAGGVIGSAFLPGAGMVAGWAAATGVIAAFRWRTVAADISRGRVVLAEAPQIDSRVLLVSRVHGIRILPDRDAGWRVRLRYGFGAPSINETPPELDLVGDDALHALRLLLPPLTRAGGSPEAVRAAVARLESDGAGSAFVAALSRQIERNLIKRRELKELPRIDRLALEMALSEELEQRAMQGELALLEAAWREAEEIAAIADDLFLPTAVRRYVERHRGSRVEMT